MEDLENYLKTKSRNQRKKTMLFIAAIIGFIVAAYILFSQVLPKISLKFISVNSEIDMGNQLFKGLKEEIKIDPHATQVLQQFADQLHLSRDYPIQVAVAVADEVNAYALPGGHIVVNTAILQTLESPESLVALLSHESTHINRRHSLQNILSSMGSGFFVGLLTNAGGSTARIILGNADFLVHMNYSRKLEKQADEEGMVLMEKNNIDPHGMLELMQRLKETNDDNSMKALSFLISHPLTDERIEDAKLFSKQHPFTKTAPPALLTDYWKQLKFLVKKED